MVTRCSVSLTSCGGQRWLRSVCLDCIFLFPSFTAAAAASLLLLWTSFSLFQRRRKKEIALQCKLDVPLLSHLFPIFLHASFSQKLQLFLLNEHSSFYNGLFDSISQFFFCICILSLFSVLPTFSVVNISEVPAQNLGRQVCLAMSLFATTPISCVFFTYKHLLCISYYCRHLTFEHII